MVQPEDREDGAAVDIILKGKRQMKRKYGVVDYLRKHYPPPEGSGEVEGLGLPIARNQFTATNKKPVPDPPFLVYLSAERQRGDDTKNRIREIEGSLELYTERKADPDLEKQIEETVLFDVEFRKYQAQIPQEDTTQTAYDFTITQKK